MSYTSEDIRGASEVFFYLLKNKIVSISDNLGSKYYDNNEIREIVENMANEAGLQIFSTRRNIHLVSRSEGSIFATTYTQMKEKYKGLDKKSYFHLANIIISIYIAEIDRENNYSFRIEDAGVSYYTLEKIISETLESWKKRSDEEESFSKDWAIAIDEIHKLWTIQMSHSKESQDGIGFSLSTNTRLGFINEALKPLQNENLIINLPKEARIFPKDELYERLENIYHRRDRYEEIMELIKNTKENSNAKTIQD